MNYKYIIAAVHKHDYKMLNARLAKDDIEATQLLKYLLATDDLIVKRLDEAYRHGYAFIETLEYFIKINKNK